MRTATRESYEERIRDVVDHVLSDLDAPLQFAQLADRACFSRWHFSRVFAGMVGETLQEFVRRLRLERAASELSRTRKPITEVAFDAGYATHESFTKAFRCAFGLSPSEFRRSRSDRCWIDAACGVHYGSQGHGSVLMLTHEGGRIMEATLKKMPALRAVCMRHIGPYHEIGAKFGELWQWIGENGVPGAQAIAFYHDDPESTPPAELRSDAGALVPLDYTTSDPRVHVLDIPPKEYAVYTHVGPYEKLGEAWGRFMGEWFPTCGREMEGSICFELYLDDCDAVPAEKLRTELYEAVKPL